MTRNWRRANRAILLLLAAALAAAAAGAAEQGSEPKRVHIYYDRVPHADPTFHFGRVHALFLQNLLGHFPHVQQHVIPIERYQSGDLEHCAAAIYLGTLVGRWRPEDPGAAIEALRPKYSARARPNRRYRSAPYSSPARQ